jgi:hypothetical protein
VGRRREGDGLRVWWRGAGERGRKQAVGGVGASGGGGSERREDEEGEETSGRRGGLGAKRSHDAVSTGVRKKRMDRCGPCTGSNGPRERHLKPNHIQSILARCFKRISHQEPNRSGSGKPMRFKISSTSIGRSDKSLIFYFHYYANDFPGQSCVRTITRSAQKNRFIFPCGPFKRIAQKN